EQRHAMRPNILRQKLEAGEPTLSTHIHSVWPAEVEALGHTGLYDYVEFVAEYGPSDLHDLDNLCRAAELFNMGSMIKIDQSLMPYLAQRGIGAGFSSVLFTDTRSIEEVRDCIRAATPDHPDHGGLYGVATRRNSYMGYGGTPEYVQSLADTVLAFMIEKKGAVDNLEQILEEPRVEMVQWGGADFSMNIGHPREMSHPDVAAAKQKTFETAIRMGVPPRAEVQSADEVKQYLDMGVRHFSVGTDIAILFSFWKTEGEKIRRALEGA
ncbi:MAG: aldolase/citrate lyase family protein, partial [Dehalococcoidia bacterium]